METLVLDGKTFVKASKAARYLGYTSDYVGQLCRGGKITSHLVGRTWYVDISQLGEHRVEKKRMSRVKAREQAHKAIEEHRLRVMSTEDKMESRVHYEEDASELIPVVRKLEIMNEHEKTSPNHRVTEAEMPAEEPFSIENKGKKILMSGKLKVVDLSDEIATDPDIVTLHARINRKVHKSVPEEIPPDMNADNEVSNVEVTEDETDIVEEPRPYINFTDRLKILDEERLEKDEPNSDPSSLVPTQAKQKGSTGYALVVLTILVLTTLSLALDAKWTLMNESQKGEGVTIDSQYVLDIMGAVSRISSKI